ncbi:MAG: glycerol-3-phosphate dehydrogenase [Alphaproteobacteria bacterium CG_4_10_14_0_2_um_filter_63_37]|nr:MAG: glycerol-3-phosphate dehydrogenase [Proteobacteria bacterium CG1_02_64_396]PJA24652.1 MAG: glycerol-3-phosphate dehydrogenase [Alphaproteobacteria bacterium CG_4_10_14_0_2_um_filter_63_37]
MIAVIGAGSWGTAIAIHLGRLGNRVSLWSFEPKIAMAINQDRENPVYLPGYHIPDTVVATPDLREALRDCRVAVFVTPSFVTAEVAAQAAPFLPSEALVACATKGIEEERLRLMHQVLMEELNIPARRLTVVSGPSFAQEVAGRQPTLLTVAGSDPLAAGVVQHLFSGENLRAYRSSDVVGVEVGGSLKNVIAIAAGICDGLGFGHNARAALITRGLHELTRLGVALGGQRETFAGLAGMGDLVLTCTGDLSRNRSVGLRIGQGETLAQIMAGRTSVAEGVKTSIAVERLAKMANVELPICSAVYHILHHGIDPQRAVEGLFARPLKDEDQL